MAHHRRVVALLTTLLAACGGELLAGTSGQSGDPGAAGAALAGSGGSGPGGAGGQGGSGQGGAGQGGAAGADLAAACRAFFRGLQAMNLRCQPGSLLEPGVEDAYVVSCEAHLRLPGVTATVAQVTACTAQLAGACGTPLPCVGGRWNLPLPAADQPGTVPSGTACQTSLQCASGTCGERPAPEPGTDGCGVCVEVRGEGQSCGLPAQRCAQDMSCQQGVCAWLHPHPGDECVDYGAEPCGPRFYCDAPAEGQQGTCQPRPTLGQACGDSRALTCRQGLWCQQGVCAEFLPLGASCDSLGQCQVYSCHDGVCQGTRYDAQAGQDCSFDQCGAGLVCSDEQVCEVPPALPVVGEGEPCLGQACAPGLVCGAIPYEGFEGFRCVKAPVAGGPCVDLGCGPLARCVDVDFGHGDPGHCVALGLEGQPCPCVDQLLCQDDVCAPFGSLSCQ